MVLTRIPFQLLLVALTLSGFLNAMENAESSYKLSGYQKLANFGGASLTYKDDTGIFTLAALKGNVPIGPQIQIPFSLSTSYYIDGEISDKGEISHAIFSTDTGIANLKFNLFSTDIRKKNDFNRDNFKGVCAFETSDAGICQFRVDAGVKVINYKSIGDKDRTASAIFASAGLQLDAPFSVKKNPYQRLTVSAFYTVQAFDTEGLFSAYYGNSNSDSPTDFSVIDLAIDYSFSRTMSLQLHGPVYSDLEDINRTAELTLTYRPYSK